MSVTPELAEWLEYLADVGYGEFYGIAGADASTRSATSELKRPASLPAERRPARSPAASDSELASGRGTAPLSDVLTRRDNEAGTVEASSPKVQWPELETVAREASGCTRCALAEGRKTVVFGSGDPDADLMFIGEGPGAEEDRQGLPFVGPAGALLTRIIQAIDLDRDEVYIANIVKCRPPRNRDPLPDEVAACRPWLEAQIRLVRPRVIVALGRVAAQALLGEETPIGKLRGRWHSVQGIPVMPTYHPAALLRNAGLKRPVWEDMQQVRERLHD